ncbi:TetR/AcrR family transcriptional regulator, partial [Oceanospirillum multiglobuliferum]|uniref:TetR/AcrR family transcriptional regulator n=1 Tax=Oceanospirillum multiglobuliferum TaxID=64969 RepID=UPI0014754670
MDAIEEWIEIGLDTLRHHGFAALKADSLSKVRHVTRGSFYNYFNAVSDFHTAIIEKWKETASQNIIVTIDKEPSKRVALEELLNIAFGNNERLEKQMRIWAENDPLPRKALIEIDDMRLTFLTRLLIENGVSPENARVFIVLCHPFLKDRRAGLFGLRSGCSTETMSGSSFAPDASTS